MNLALGGQTVTVHPQVRGQHGRRHDGPPRSTAGCSLQPDAAPAEGLDSGRDQQTARWTLYAAPRFRAAGDDVVTVSPGPVDAVGAPARLALIGDAQPWWDEDGAEHHVVATLRRIT